MTQIAAPNLASPQFKANPYPFYARLRAEAPVYRTRLPSRQVAWLVTRYEDVLMVLKDERFAKDQLRATTPEQRAKVPWVPGLLKPLTRNMLDLDGSDHARLRRLVHKAFTPRRIEELRERIQMLCDDLLDAVQPNGSMKLVRAYALPLPFTIIAELLGIPPEDRRRFHSWSNSVVGVTSTFDLLLALPQIWLFMPYLRTLLKQGRKTPGTTS